MKKALLVIDVQNYFLNSHTKHLPEKIVKYLRRRHRDFALVIFTRFVNNPRSSSYRLLNWRKCLKSPDTDLVEELKPILTYGSTISKSVLSALKVSRVQKLLRKHKITDLYLCGIDTDCCVLATAYDAFDEGYRISVLGKLSMAHTGRSLHKAALRIVSKNIGSVVSSKK